MSRRPSLTTTRHSLIVAIDSQGPNVLRSLPNLSDVLAGIKQRSRQSGRLLTTQIPQTLYHKLLEPRSHDEVVRRREFMINVLVCGLAVITVAKWLLSVTQPHHVGIDQDADSLVINGMFLLLLAGIWRLCRRGHLQLAAFGLLTVLALEAMRVTLNLSFELPVAELLYAVIIVTAGVLLAARGALIITGVVSVLLLAISYGQITHHLQPHTEWLQKDFQMADAIGYVALLGVIALASWLTNHEVSRSLALVRLSEAELAKERDNLEIKIAERTKELQNSQMLRNAELERFAEFGRVSAGLLHEVANPLTAASLNLEQLDDIDLPLIIAARQNLRQLERYLDAARRQLKTSSELSTFSVRGELRQLQLIMQPLARQQHIRLRIVQNGTYKLYGDPVKFNQLVANLVANALDAYAESVITEGRKRQVDVSVESSGQWLRLTVSDWGKGIPADAIPLLFEPFYTTKTAGGRGTGLGLAMVKQIVEHEYGGSVSVTSQSGKGTQFKICLRQPEKNVLLRHAGGAG